LLNREGSGAWAKVSPKGRMNITARAKPEKKEWIGLRVENGNFLMNQLLCKAKRRKNSVFFAN
jgi:hypothetical protein